MATWSGHLVVVIAALALDAVIGDPDWLWRRLPHPIVLIGRAIDALDQGVNREAQSPAMRRLAGVLATTVLVATALLV